MSSFHFLYNYHHRLLLNIFWRQGASAKTDYVSFLWYKFSLNTAMSNKHSMKVKPVVKPIDSNNGLHSIWLLYLIVPLLVCFGGISGEFGRALVCILARYSQAKIPMARPKASDMPQKRAKKVRLGIYCTQIQPKIRRYCAISGQWLDIIGYQDSRLGLWLAKCEFGVKSNITPLLMGYVGAMVSC